MDTLFLIPARGGSKGIPGKNIKELHGKPLINYAIDIAREFAKDDCICVSTDDKKIIKVVEEHDLSVPFMRPDKFSSDNAGSYEVIMHALNWYEKKNIFFKQVVLLQPTSPFRLKKHVTEALSIYTDTIDMVVSVNKIKNNPYSTFYKIKNEEFITKAFVNKTKGIRRQDSETLYELNGAIYVLNVSSLKKNKLGEFKKVKMVEMEAISSIDIDVPLDWKWCEFIMKEKLIKFDFKSK